MLICPLCKKQEGMLATLRQENEALKERLTMIPPEFLVIKEIIDAGNDFVQYEGGDRFMRLARALGNIRSLKDTEVSS